MIKVENVSFVYEGGAKNALDDISFTLSEGEMIGLTGPSGAGKTTLIRAMCGVVPHRLKGDFYGSVSVDGTDTVDTRPDETARLVGCVFSDTASQTVAATVSDEIRFGLENFGVPRGEVEDRITEALKTTGIEDLRERSMNALSGGQRQKVLIAAITAQKQKYLLLDEPTGELDPQSSRRMFELFERLRREYGIGIIIAEQKIMLLSEFADRLIIMEKGGIALEGETADVLENADEMRRIGVNVPRIVTLYGGMREKGLYGGRPPRDLTEAAAMFGVVK